jgi:hypothetical protein
MGIAGGKNLDDVLAERERARGEPFSLPIYTLMPEFVLLNTQRNNMIARACGLDGFVDDSGFDAFGRVVGGHFALRGVRRKVAAEGGAQRSQYDLHLKTILESPVPNAQTAAALLAKANEFYNPRK